MNNARTYLNTHAPELYDAYIKTWDIANRDLFPKMPSGKDSLNSFPHIQNLENYFVHILELTPELLDKESDLCLKPVEMYVMLCSILLHDIGRIWKETDKIKHGSSSKKLIRENYEKFNLFNKELAYIIGDVCEYHDPSEDPGKEMDLNDTVVDRFGVIRAKELATFESVNQIV